VATLVADDFVSMMGPNLDSHEVGHAASRKKQRGFLAERLGGQFFEAIYGRVFALNVVAD